MTFFPRKAWLSSWVCILHGWLQKHQKQRVQNESEEKNGSVTSFAYFWLLGLFIPTPRRAHVHSIVERPLRFFLSGGPWEREHILWKTAKDSRGSCVRLWHLIGLQVVTATHTYTLTHTCKHSYSVLIIWLAGSQTPTYINWLYNLFESAVEAECRINIQHICVW